MKHFVLMAALLVASAQAQNQMGQSAQSKGPVKVVLKETKTEQTAAGTIRFYEDTNTTGALHTTETVTYPFYPPVRGLHFPYWANCGIYLKAIDPRLAVHSLEHGALWVTYKSSTDARKLAFLQTLVKGNPYRLMSMEPKQKADVVLSAWGVQLVVTNWDEKAIKAFADKYTNGPTTPEPGAPCSGAITP
ncbi:DUF3105 domain-containing protein [Deinococcus cellulosilyticus]|uniref:DUF3105 domain-containing protein n=1 Tax=Deinococcus cellulosilyticus (strain DSM 18568 / NBRC 106333 / KACC 11606 / 5516J-15) TaxID=1223518 RepID=A0A511N3V8_DEIC1|nr:DUF3105 domain-containing protein [Deinococcus cellulosilyticus]GEM47096.1 hypothetical protein DC3_27310 [Deinococcus cellulosilyticus NBRC 106333 = KACC 11606]